MLWFVALAAAHSPHDIIPALSVADGFVVLGEEVRLARSSDDGQTLLHSDSPGSVSRCLAALAGTPGSVLMVTKRPAVFLSGDGGVSWSEMVSRGASTCSAGLNGALYADVEGVHRLLPDGETLELADSTPISVLAESDRGTLVALSDDGALLREAGTSWEIEDAGPYTALAAGDGVLLRGSMMGIEVSRDDGDTWLFISDVPAALLAAGETAWMATTFEDGVWLSEDQGQTWVVERGGLETLATGAGAPKVGATHWYALIDDGGTLWAAAWEGLYRRYPGESAWTQLQTRGQPYTRDLAWVGEELLVAANGGGLARGVPGEAGWVDAAPRLAWPWLRTIVATENGAGAWFFNGGQHLYRSDDQGASVETVITGTETDGDVVAVAADWPADTHVWESGQDADGNGLVVESADGGETWVSTVLAPCVQKPGAMVSGAGGVYVGCNTGLWRRDGPGVWTAMPDPGGDVSVLLLDGSAVIVGTPTGVVRVTDRVEPVYGPGPVDTLAWEPDGALLIACDEGLVRVVDGVATPLGWPEADVVVALSVDPTGRIAASTYSGAWVSDDRGDTWTLATDWDRFDDNDTAFYYSGEWESLDDSKAKSKSVHQGEGGVRWRVEGARVALLGAGSATFRVSVDDATAETVTTAADRLRVIWAADVAPGWHWVEVTVVSGVLELDGGERWRMPGEVAVVESPTPTGCGCESGAGTAGLFASLAAFVGVRRRARDSS